MNIQKIYERYKIMPQLQMHMLRVAGVASMICDNFDKPLDKKSTISACLVHDMGNIIKFDFDSDFFPESWFQPGGKIYWKDIKVKFTKKYGGDEHFATNRITRELDVDKKIIRIVKSYGFSKAKKIYNSKDFRLKISCYSDHRVTPLGVASLNERIAEGQKRYSDKFYAANHTKTKKEFDVLTRKWKLIEKQIFSKCKIKPQDITEEKVNPLIAELKNFDIKTNL